MSGPKMMLTEITLRSDTFAADGSSFRSPFLTSSYFQPPYPERISPSYFEWVSLNIWSALI